MEGEEDSEGKGRRRRRRRRGGERKRVPILPVSFLPTNLS